MLAICGASITDARIFTRKDGIVIDRFAIQDELGNPFSEDRRQQRISQRLRQVLNGELELEKAVKEAEERYPDTTAAFEIQPKIFFDNEASATHTLLEVQGLDRRGVLYRITDCLSLLKLSVSTAHIATYGEKLVDVFYIKDAFGHKLYHRQRQAELRQKLLKLLR